MLTDEKILSIVANELSSAQGGDFDSGAISANRERSLAYYLGQATGTEVEGRSKVVSTDVADCIEWIMPEVMKAFTHNNEIVKFDPVGPDDETQAELESAFVYDILMKDNNGFITIHQLAKDALMQKNGIAKVFYEEIYEIEVQHHTGISLETAEYLLGDPNIELMEKTSMPKHTNNSCSNISKCHHNRCSKHHHHNLLNQLCCVI
jgi:hypothetical protein